VTLAGLVVCTMRHDLPFRSRTSSIALIVALAVAFGPASTASGRPATQAVSLSDTSSLVTWWNAAHVGLPPPPLARQGEILQAIARLDTASPGLLETREIGTSVKGKPLVEVQVGRGPLHVMLWSQMHGDEPTATVALVDLLALLTTEREAVDVRRLLDRLTLHVVPMLNPDGAEQSERRNAQGLDINRDALLLQSPESRALKALRDRTNAAVGFNLHNQGWRTSIGQPPRPATISLLSVAFDEARTESEGRQITKRLCAVVRDALEPLIPGQIGRYDDEFEVRAFGDNLTRWGTSVVLIETGAWAGPDADATLVRLNFVAIVTALDSLATGRVRSADPGRYETLPANEDRLLHTVIRNATIVPGTGVASFSGDVGVSAVRAVREVDGVRKIVTLARIEDVGDLRTWGALETIDAQGQTLVPAFVPGARPGDVVMLPDWAALPPHAVIAVGQPASFFLLEPTPIEGSYRIWRVITVGEPR
jgi:hypothetical protein